MLFWRKAYFGAKLVSAQMLFWRKACFGASLYRRQWS
jgi:hypothetical protein